MTGRGDAGAAVHREPHVAAIVEHRLARVHADANTHLLSVGPHVFHERALCGDGRTDGITCARKDDEERVALRVDLVAVVYCECLAEQATVLCQHFAVLLP